MEKTLGVFARLKADIANTFVSIMKGHWVTWSNMWRERQTLQYPNERPVLPERYRGLQGVHPELCIVCGACAKACPAQVITIEGRKIAGTKHRELTRYILEAGRCMFCGLCEEACPTKPLKAIRMSNAYELSAGNKGALILEMPQLEVIWRSKPVEMPEEEYLANTPRKQAERDLAAAASGESPNFSTSFLRQRRRTAGSGSPTALARSPSGMDRAPSFPAASTISRTSRTRVALLR